jgi:hypothetical protein
LERFGNAEATEVPLFETRQGRERFDVLDDYALVLNDELWPEVGDGMTG